MKPRIQKMNKNWYCHGEDINRYPIIAQGDTPSDSYKSYCKIRLMRFRENVDTVENRWGKDDKDSDYVKNTSSIIDVILVVLTFIVAAGVTLVTYFKFMGC